MEIHRTKILGCALLLFGLVLCGVGFWLLLGPAQFEAAVKIRIRPDVIADPAPLDAPVQDPCCDPYFIQTEFEIIQSEVVLSKVVKTLNLNVEWGKSHAEGNQLKTVDAVNLLGRRMSLRLVHNTRLMEINVTGDDPNETALLANTVADAYRKFRREQRQQLMIHGIQFLTEQYQYEEEKIRMLQTNVDLLRTKHKINQQDEADETEISPSRLTTPAEREERQKEYERTKPFWDEKRKLNALLDFHKLLAAKIEREKLDLNTPKPSSVEIVNLAAPPKFPAGPDRALGALLSAMGLFPLVGGFLLLKASRRPVG